jgi:hypothetical protein
MSTTTKTTTTKAPKNKPVKPLNGKFDINSLAKMIIEKRTSENLGLRESAKLCKVSYPTLHRIETKKPCHVDHLSNVCNWLGISVQSLFVK